MADRSDEDILREEYFDLLPEIRRVAEFLEVEVKHAVFPLFRNAEKHEQWQVKSRVKACDSAVESLLHRRRKLDRHLQNHSAKSDKEMSDGRLSLTELNDLAAVRVLAFPRKRLAEIDAQLRRQFPKWTADGDFAARISDDIIAFQYHGLCEVSQTVKGEYQIVSTLIGLFWEVEHASFYKLDSRFKSEAYEPAMKLRCDDVYRSLRAFEEEFEQRIEAT